MHGSSGGRPGKAAAILRRNRAGQDFPGDRKRQVSSDADGPFDEGGCKLTDLDAGNVSGADTAAGIIIAGGSFQYRPVGVTGNQDALVCPCPA